MRSLYAQELKSLKLPEKGVGRNRLLNLLLCLGTDLTEVFIFWEEVLLDIWFAGVHGQRGASGQQKPNPAVYCVL